MSERPTHRCEGCGEWLHAHELLDDGSDGHVVPTSDGRGGMVPDLCGPVRRATPQQEPEAVTLTDELEMRQGAHAILDPTSHAPRPSINDLAAWVLLLIDYRRIGEAQQEPEGDGITYPYPDDRERTHWEGCWQDPGHHNCAVAEVHRLRARVQPRRVSEAEVRGMAEDLAQHGYTWTGDIIRHVLSRLGIEITPEEENDDG